MASLFGALDTAVSGLTAQSAAFSTISDNIANSQTTGFKAANTTFSDYLTTSTAATNDSGFVSARPEYENTGQGTIAASTNATALAISGSGFFQVNHETIDATGASVLGAQTQYTRDGNFKLDSNGYLVNDSSEALNGWSVNPTTGIANQNTAMPIKVNQSPLPPTATATVTLAANLPASPASTAPISSQVNVYDAKGTLHSVGLQWTQNSADTWTVAISAPDAATTALGSAQVTFGAASGNAVAAGTVGSISGDTGTVTSTAYSATGPATLNFTADFGSGAQPVTLNLGAYGASKGLTQYAGTTYTLNGLTQDGVAPAAFSGVTVQPSGDVVANYANGATKIVAQVPLTKFANPDALQRQDGQGFTATTASGAGLVEAAGSGGVGTLVASATEGSTVDIATEFTKLIVAQQAYSANSKVVTTAEQLLQTTLNMKT